jgi:D-3-phosphoglycerate dehydrogenase
MIISSEKLPEKAKQIIQVKDENITEKDLEEAIALLTWPRKIAEYINRMPNLKVIQTFSAGVDDVPFSIIPSNVIIFSNAGAYALPVAEHAFGLILSLAKGINKRKRIESYQLNGKAILILGAGGIGSEIAKIAKKGFNMKTIGVSRSFKNPELFDEKYPLDKLNEIIEKGDIIVDALPLNKETYGILNYENLGKMKDKAILVNVGRGETIVEKDIIRILKERPSIRFGTDVFWRVDGNENFDSELWNMENFAGTLHTAGGYASKEVLENAMIRACENLAKYLREGKADNEVKVIDYK